MEIMVITKDTNTSPDTTIARLVEVGELLVVGEVGAAKVVVLLEAGVEDDVLERGGVLVGELSVELLDIELEGAIGELDEVDAPPPTALEDVDEPPATVVQGTTAV